MIKSSTVVNILTTIIVSSILFLAYAALQNAMHPLNEFEPSRLGLCVTQSTEMNYAMIAMVEQPIEQNGIISCPIGQFVPVIPGPPKS